MTASPRALMPDYLRLVALFGIVVVNVQYIAFSALHGIADPVAETSLDAITLWLVNGLALLKTYGLFSFMFGVGLGFLMRSAARRGLPFGRVYRNRTTGLLILGIALGCLCFPGDMIDPLPVSELAGAAPCKGPFIAPPPLLAAPETLPDIVAMERAILANGSSSRLSWSAASASPSSCRPSS